MSERKAEGLFDKARWPPSRTLARTFAQPMLGSALQRAIHSHSSRGMEQKVKESKRRPWKGELIGGKQKARDSRNNTAAAIALDEGQED